MALTNGPTNVERAKLSLFSPEKSHNRLHLAVDRKHKDFYFGETQENLFVVALGQNDGLFNFDSSEHKLCANVVSLDSDHSLASEPNTCQVENNAPPNNFKILALYCTQFFLDHYGLKAEELYHVWKISPAPLQKVTLSTIDPDVFAWTNSHVFSTGLLVNVCNQYRLLARRDDKFSIPFSPMFESSSVKYDNSFLCALDVVDTEPFSQGVITLNTEFVVLKCAVNSSPTSTSQDGSMPRKPFGIQVSDFAVPHTSVFIPRQVNAPVLWKDSEHNVTLQRDWNVLNCNHLYTQDIIPVHSNIDYTVYVEMATAKKFSLFNDSFIEIQAVPKSIPKCAPLQHQQSVIVTGEAATNQTPSKTPAKVCRIVNVRIFAASSENVTDTVFVPAVLWYNIYRQLSRPAIQDMLVKVRKHKPEGKYVTSTSGSWEGKLLYAREVYVSCVYSPQYSTGAAYNKALEIHFSTPRTLQQGDVFAVDTHNDVEGSAADSSGGRVVYFRVRRLTPRTRHRHETYLVDTQHSALFQDSPCHSYVPSSVESMLHGGHHSSIMAGLDQVHNTLTSLIQPCLDNWNESSETVPSILLHGAAGCGKTSVCKAVAAAANMHYFKVNCHDLCGETSSATEARILQYMMRGCMYSPCILHLHNIHALGRDRDGNNEDARVTAYFHECIQNVLHKESADWPVVVIATTSSLTRLTSDMHAGFLHTYEICVPDEGTRARMLKSLLSSTQCGSSLSISRIAQRTAGFVLGDLIMLVAQAKKEAYRNVVDTCLPAGRVPSVEEEYGIRVCGPLLQQSHCDTALDHMQAAHSDAIGAPKIPNVTWDDVGGLAAVKADILDTVQLPLQHPELFCAGLRRSGVLLFGPPGTGKTLLAKAVATECSLNFLSVKGPELINMYVGQSEENIREVFSRARNATPCVIFFDELDSLAPNRGRSGDSGGVMDRVVSQLLAELDGLHKACDVFVIGATNRPDLLDPALLRPGRFDKLLFLGVSEDKKSQLNILEALTRKFCLSSSCNLSEIVEKCPLHMTGADFYALCSDAMLNALKRQIQQLETGVEVEDERVEVCGDDFYQALDSLVPSVSTEQLQHYKYLQKTLTIGK